jgi:cyclohexanone monooxygenase
MMTFAADERARVLEELWSKGGFAFQFYFPDLMVNEEANTVAAEFVRNKIRTLVKNPKVAEMLTPTNAPLGAKRLCLDSNYYDTFNRPNVTLVDVRRTPIGKITPKGIAWEGKEQEFDMMVFATGFDAMTGALMSIDIRGKDGITLQEGWAAGPRTFLGLGAAGFPNMFFVAGPGSPSVLAVVVVAIEQHVDWILDCVDYMRIRGFETIEATIEAQDQWVEHVNEVANMTLFPKGNSWYLGANVPGKPRVFMPYIGGLGAYRQKCEDVAAAGYAGFTLGR